MKFIDKVVDDLKDKISGFENLVIVLPSQRAKKYFQKALFKVNNTPLVSPEIVTIDRWIAAQVPFPIIDNTRAVFKLYDVHKVLNNENDISLDEFMKWGATLLSDFDELDRYLIHYEDLFKNLADIKEIENWSFNSTDLTPAQKRFMEFWDGLPKYYQEFNDVLKKEELFYAGAAFKYFAENIDLAFAKNKDLNFVFVGFNALSNSEISIIKQLQKMGRARVYIDADKYYVENKNHEAGMFIRNLKQALNIQKIPFEQNQLLTTKKHIRFINCAQVTGQGKVSATVLNEEIPANKQSETLLLLADEKLVVPIIKNIPKNVEKANITIGLPLKNTALRSWVNILFDIQEHFNYFKTKAIYHKDIISFVKHPIVQAFINDEERIALLDLENKVLNDNWLFVDVKKLNLSNRLKVLFDLCTKKWDSMQHLGNLQNIRKVNELLLKNIDLKLFPIEQSIVFHFDEALVKLENILADFKPEITIKTFKTIFNQHWMRASIAYYGNPLNGLQVMGLLETRLLDFENLIVVGLNDGKLPPDNPIQTLIPMDLRKWHGLPTPREKQGLFAHHFYRLLHYAKNIWITYSSAQSQGNFDEPSRYIQQIQLELARLNPDIKVEKLFYTINDEDQNNKPVLIEKTNNIIERLDQYFSNKTSASALNTYFNCPLDFYYRYVLGFGEENTIQEEVQSNTFGTFIHEVLEVLYRPYAKYNKEEQVVIENPPPIHGMVLSGFKNQVIGLLKSSFNEHYKHNKQVLSNGKNYLTFEIAQHLIYKFLEVEKALLKAQKTNLTILSLESNFSREMTVVINGKSKKILFSGVIDRIDMLHDTVRIIDYKSGTCQDKDVQIPKAKSNESPSEALVRSIKTNKFVFQLLLYNYLYFGKHHKYPELTGILSMVKMKEGVFYLKNELTDSTESLMDLFEEAMAHILTEIYDKDTPFSHNAESKYCDYC